MARTKKPTERRGGIVLHVSSLPSPGPVGDLGPTAHRFIEWLEQAGCRLWQVLPLQPVGPGLSPYSSPSAMASEVALISLEGLIEDGLLEPLPPQRTTARVDWQCVRETKLPLLHRAAERFAADAPREIDRYAEENAWVRDWALYSVLSQAEGGWWEWREAALRQRDPKALDRERDRHAPAIRREIALQLLFDRQWGRLRAAAERADIQIMGDVPIFVTGQSCDTWTHSDLFQLDGQGRPTALAGVPPDYFSRTGQLWGHPLYDWDAHERDDFAWWNQRIARCLSQAHRVRLDHFRGFCAAWAVPKGEKTAIKGEWQPGPGARLFHSFLRHLPKPAIGADAGDADLPACGPALPFVAEDLGTITEDVFALRDEFGLPGMKVLQFAFGGSADHPFLPHNYDHARWVVYSGTHDNDTAVGWYASVQEKERHAYRVYVGRDGSEPGWDLIRLAWASIARDALVPMQDVLGLGSEHRMNLPGKSEGNWAWRVSNFPWYLAERLRLLSEAYGRG